MHRKTLVMTGGVLAAGLWLTSAATSWAQHHRPGVATHRTDLHVVDPRGRPVTEHHESYRFVVPSTSHHGTYYTHEKTHYYTAPPPRVLAGSPPPAASPPVALAFGAFKHYEQLAERLDTLANQFCLDLHHNYQDNRNFKETYREAYQVLQAAKYVHGSEHKGDREAIRRSANSLDKQFHHVQEEVSTWKGASRKQVGELGTLAKLEELEALIHHLAFDLGVKPDHAGGEKAPPPGDEAAPPPR